MKRLGPELKMPKLKGGEMKVPPFLSDLYFDLRERRLLPLVALLLVGIVAAPILLGSGSSEEEPVPVTGAGSGSQPNSEGQTLNVVKAAPGLRNYKKRLAHRDPTDPFKQRYTQPQLSGSELNEKTSSTTTGSVTTSESSTSTESSGGNSSSGGGKSGGAKGGGNGGNSGGGTLQPGELQLYTFAIDIRFSHNEITPSGATKMGDPVKRERVKRGTSLPGEKAPVLTYIGTDTEAKKALMLVSPEVVGLQGDNKCLAGTSTCQLLSLEPGVPEVVEYGPNGVRYKFELLKIEPVKGAKIKDPKGAQAEIPNG